jgi:hypothetical protein
LHQKGDCREEKEGTQREELPCSGHALELQTGATQGQEKRGSPHGVPNKDKAGARFCPGFLLRIPAQHPATHLKPFSFPFIYPPDV